MPGCRTTKSPRRRGWRAARLEPHWRARAGDWSTPMMQDWKEDSMSHVDEGTLHAYLDGELPPAERSAIDTHIADCATFLSCLTYDTALQNPATSKARSVHPAYS